MRSYTPNSPEAMARIVCMCIMADSDIDASEFAELQPALYAAVGLTHPAVVLATQEMEAAGLYACAAAEGGEALTVLTVSDHLFDSSRDMSSEERETLYATSVRIAAAALLA